MSKVTLGGENRLGSGGKLKVDMKEYQRSTFDLGYVWKNTQAPGTLVPFCAEIVLPGDTVDVTLTAETMTLPTLGPLFGSYKQQMDMFFVPLRLFNPKLQLDLQGQGLKMKEIKFPQLRLKGRKLDLTKSLSNQHVNNSCILKYLGISGIGNNNYEPDAFIIERLFNAFGLLSYCQIYKEYYANPQEGVGAVVSSNSNATTADIDTDTGIIINWGGGNVATIKNGQTTGFYLDDMSTGEIQFSQYQEFDLSRVKILAEGWGAIPITELFGKVEWQNPKAYLTQPLTKYMGKAVSTTGYVIDRSVNIDEEPQIELFPLTNIDQMRQDILTQYTDTAFIIDEDSLVPYNTSLRSMEEGGMLSWTSATAPQEGLLLKTYQGDKFNNWLNKEWIAGSNGVNELSKIVVGSDGAITIDEINMANKVYNVLNRIVTSGGSLNDYSEAVYGVRARTSITSPLYIGGLSKEIVFQEVVSTAASNEDPLGTLAGKGRMGSKHKGGKVHYKVNEAGIVMGIVSLTPRISYSQGNDWSVNLQSYDDLHKPGLDQIGFQDLITDQLHYADTEVNAGDGGYVTAYASAGKQPAWINYMTKVDRNYGMFADEDVQMFMVLDRRYEIEVLDQSGYLTIKDLTTYVDPGKFNYIFADTKRSGQNFWLQIGVDMELRRVMSSKVMPMMG